MLPLFAGAIFLGAWLIFLVQPMAARMVLPSLGGSPAVWNTCMVFFQAALLAGYGYAHWATRALGVRRHAAVHAVVVLLPLLALPVMLRGGTPPAGGSPVAWLLGALALSVGLPFVVAATGAPLLQRWIAATGHPRGKDPYFLYAASNAGSLLALIGYPLVLEPLLTLKQQRWVWSAGYLLLAGLVIGCAVVTFRSARPAAQPAPSAAEARPTWGRRAFWVVAAAVPSSYLLGVTQFLSTDIAAVPLLWVVPLSLYLLTFILAFSSRPLVPLASISRLLPLLLIGLAVAMMLSAKHPVWLVITLHLSTFFGAALLCHGRLAGSRPGPGCLTEFYLLLALGGVLGGMVNALLAPVAFNTLVEYPLAILAACLFRGGDWPRGREGRLWVHVLFDAALGWALIVILLFGLELLVRRLGLLMNDPTKPLLGVLTIDQAQLLVVIGIPAALVYVFGRWPLRFALGLSVLLWVGQLSPRGRSLLVERTFFGVYHVQDMVDDTGQRRHMLVHGTTEHGAQFWEPEKRGTALTYYHPDGPVGAVFGVLGDRVADRAGFVGMGTGALAAYGEAGRRFTFFEIDPAVVRIAQNPAYFTFLTDAGARGLEYDVVLGDGRLSLRDRAAEGEFGLIVLDAFTSDAIPVHLMTREATELYMSRLRPGGVVAFHISNVYLELRPVVAGIVRDLGLVALDMNDPVDPEQAAEAEQSGRSASHWILVARKQEDFGLLTSDRRWRVLATPPDAPRWTDDYSNILGVFRWD